MRVQLDKNTYVERIDGDKGIIITDLSTPPMEILLKPKAVIALVEYLEDMVR